MRAKFIVPSFLVLLGLVGCGSKAEPPAETAAPAVPAVPAAPPSDAERAAPMQATASPITPLQKKQFGAPITETATTALPALLKEPGKYDGKIVRTEGVVSAVCKSMGCWMEIADESGSAHIKMAGHSFFVPRNASGHRAVVQGKVITEPAEGGAMCGAKDNCRAEAEKQTGRVAKLEIEATGVEFLD